MHIHRLFEIVYLLMNKKTMTSGELAEHFEVSKRTILRDIEALSAAGIPVYTTQGKGGGIFLMENYVLNRSLLSEHEQNQILLGLQGVSVTNQLDTESLLGKMETLFNKGNTDWIEVDFSRWGHGNADNQRFDTIKQAILSERAIKFTYVNSSGEESTRHVFPLKLIFKSQSWYLQGFCAKKQEYRTFKLKRILRVLETSDAFSRSKYTPPPIESVDPSSNNSVLLEMEFPSHVAYRLYDEFDAAVIETGDDGFLRVNVRLPENDWLYGFLLSFGKDVCVIAPKHVREKLKKQRL